MDHNKVSVHKNANKEKKELSQYAISAILTSSLVTYAFVQLQLLKQPHFQPFFSPITLEEEGREEAWERDWSITAEV